jgi:hypothetical protein
MSHWPWINPSCTLQLYTAMAHQTAALIKGILDRGALLAVRKSKQLADTMIPTPICMVSSMQEVGVYKVLYKQLFNGDKAFIVVW